MLNITDDDFDEFYKAADDPSELADVKKKQGIGTKPMPIATTTELDDLFAYLEEHYPDETPEQQLEDFAEKEPEKASQLEDVIPETAEEAQQVLDDNSRNDEANNEEIKKDTKKTWSDYIDEEFAKAQEEKALQKSNEDFSNFVEGLEDKDPEKERLHQKYKDMLAEINPDILPKVVQKLQNATQVWGKGKAAQAMNAGLTGDPFEDLFKYYSDYRDKPDYEAIEKALDKYLDVDSLKRMRGSGLTENQKKYFADRFGKEWVEDQETQQRMKELKSANVQLARLLHKYYATNSLDTSEEMKGAKQSKYGMIGDFAKGDFRRLLNGQYRNKAPRSRKVAERLGNAKYEIENNLKELKDLKGKHNIYRMDVANDTLPSKLGMLNVEDESSPETMQQNIEGDKARLQEALNNKNAETVENVIESNPEAAEEVIPESNPISKEVDEMADGDKRTDEVNNQTVKKGLIDWDKVHVYKPGEDPYDTVDHDYDPRVEALNEADTGFDTGAQASTEDATRRTEETATGEPGAQAGESVAATDSQSDASSTTSQEPPLAYNTPFEEFEQLSPEEQRLRTRYNEKYNMDPEMKDALHSFSDELEKADVERQQAQAADDYMDDEEKGELAQWMADNLPEPPEEEQPEDTPYFIKEVEEEEKEPFNMKGTNINFGGSATVTPNTPHMEERSGGSTGGIGSKMVPIHALGSGSVTPGSVGGGINVTPEPKQMQQGRGGSGHITPGATTSAPRGFGSVNDAPHSNGTTSSGAVNYTPKSTNYSAPAQVAPKLAMLGHTSQSGMPGEVPSLGLLGRNGNPKELLIAQLEAALNQLSMKNPELVAKLGFGHKYKHWDYNNTTLEELSPNDLNDLLKKVQSLN